MYVKLSVEYRVLLVKLCQWHEGLLLVQHNLALYVCHVTLHQPAVHQHRHHTLRFVQRQGLSKGA